jgi:ubiquinone/menaquinone biosynthesis C-methylase UbiE
MNEFWKILNTTDGGEVLDVACGTGQFAGILKEYLKSFTHITGIDVDSSSLRDAAGKFDQSRFTFLQADTRKIPFPGEHFDTVTISKGLHHLEDVRQGLQEMLRVLKKGGLMIISEMYSDGLTEPQKSHMFYHHLRVEVDRSMGIIHNYTFLKAQILDLVRELNLQDFTERTYTEDDGSKESMGEYLARMEIWKEYFRDSDNEGGMQMKIEALKNRFTEVGIARPPQLVLMGYK